METSFLDMVTFPLQNEMTDTLFIPNLRKDISGGLQWGRVPKAIGNSERKT